MNRSSARVALFAATSFAALGFASQAAAQGAASGAGLSVEDAPLIVSNNNVSPNQPVASGGALDLGVTGVGQQIAVVPSPNPLTGPGRGLSLCTGTLINPRTVIFAAHCVNARPAHVYGSASGSGLGVPAGLGLPTSTGVPLSFGFSATNRCTGSATAVGNGCLSGTGAYEVWRDSGYQTQTQLNIYNANQIWYDPRSLTTPGSNGFIAADVALATLDTPAFGIPTWTMLFSPLTAPTHAFSNGYGVNGTSATGQGATPCNEGPPAQCGVLGAIDYRRRIVENSLDVLGSLQDRNAFLFGAASAGVNSNSVYMLDFDSPAGQAAYTGTFNNYDFDVFNGAALPREGTTAGGDSGGPLIVDQAFNKPVTVAVLSGGSRFLSGQRFSTYGTHSFYQPLFLYWDVIVGNNPYVYAGAKAGDGNWEDASHWVQLMDPNYAITVDGALANSLPDTPALGVSPNTVKFGEVCFLDDCTDLANDDTATAPPVGNGTPVFVQGGPGTVNFVPDNITPVNSANASLTVKARYYDVTLATAGTTTLSSARTIDVLTLDGNASKLKINASGTLNVFGEFNQWQGWTQVDGRLASGGDTFIGSGLLSGSGTLQAPFVTVGAAVVAPGGGDRVGTLTIQGDAILSSGSSLFVDARRGSADRLTVTGDLALSGGDVVFNKVTDAPAPRDGESYIIASAGGELLGEFGKVFTFQGVLRPTLSYNTAADTVTATLRAGSLVEVLDGGNAMELAFASVLDQLRNGYYNSLYNLYGSIDWMSGSQLSATFQSMTPSIVGETKLLQDRQSRQLLGNVTDRLSLLGTGRAAGFTFTGGASALAQSRDRLSVSGQLGLSSGGSAKIASPAGLSGFVAMGGDTVRASYGDSDREGAGQRGRYFASGVETPIGDVMVGVAMGYAEASTIAGSDEAKSKVTQAAAYASLPVGKTAYIGGIFAAERAQSGSDRLSTDGTSMVRLSGAGRSSRYMATAEAGFRSGIGGGLAIN
ncbi:MAG: hypothetical protein H0V46_00310, partial [Sphingomonas sp.]|nr:hypothetical protein [Sphingomonas sp.]